MYSLSSHKLQLPATLASGGHMSQAATYSLLLACAWPFLSVSSPSMRGAALVRNGMARSVATYASCHGGVAGTCPGDRRCRMADAI